MSKPLNILIFGYYFRQNFGDDLFQYIFEKYIFNSSNYNLIFKNIDDLDLNIDIYSTVDKIIIGGGDLINNFFLNDSKINSFRQYFSSDNSNFNNIPIYFIGIGITYPDIINILDIGDYFYVRSTTDLKLISNRYTSNHCTYIPDLAFNLLNEPILSNYSKPILNSNGIQKIGICLPYTYISISSNSQILLNDICSFIQNLASSYKIYLIPFDTSIDPINSDILLNNQISNIIGNCNGNVFYMNPPRNSNGTYQSITITQMIEYFQSLDFVFTSRFHSVILSIITNTPFISIYSTSKIYNLYQDLLTINPIFSNLFVKLKLDNNNAPIDLDFTSIQNSFAFVSNNYNEIISNLNTVSQQYKQLSTLSIQTILDLCNSSDIIKIFRQSPPQYITHVNQTQLIDTTIKNVLSKVLHSTSPNDIDSIINGKPIINLLPRATQNDLNIYSQLITEEILWNITGDPYAPYYYGLCNNILNNKFISQLQWIISDYYQNYYYRQIISSPITLINKNFQQIHRSGWQYIINNIYLQLNDSLSIKQPLIVDTFIDKTFNWNNEFYSSKKIIPYTSPWIGFIHHTYSDYNNNYNCSTLFTNTQFLNSLSNCKCLIVLTQYLSKQIKTSIEQLNLPYFIPIINIVHPSNNPDIIFDWDTFLNNPNKKIIQIGNWLRNIFGIYRLDLPSTSIISHKAILQNNNSSNYFPPNNFLNTLYTQLNYDQYPVNTPSNQICRTSFTNMHIQGLYDTIVNMEHSVTIIPFQNDMDYDLLLSQNIVFLNLVDASAVNTIIECILRNTPMLVNPLPAVVEVLGQNYPLYYKTFYEASKILDNQDLLYQGYLYLCNMEKFQFGIDNFISNLTNILVSIDNNQIPTLTN